MATSLGISESDVLITEVAIIQSSLILVTHADELLDPSPDVQTQFSDSFALDISLSLEIPQHSIQVKNISILSRRNLDIGLQQVSIEFQISLDASNLYAAGFEDGHDVVSELSTQVADENSILMNGSVTSKVEIGQVIVAVVTYEIQLETTVPQSEANKTETAIQELQSINNLLIESVSTYHSSMASMLTFTSSSSVRGSTLLGRTTISSTNMQSTRISSNVHSTSTTIYTLSSTNKSLVFSNATWAIICIAIGFIALSTLFILLARCLWRRKKDKVVEITAIGPKLW